MKFIPEEPDSKTNFSETQVFDALRGFTESRDWTVFHSLKIGQNIVAYTGEADFVVLIPNKGIVVVEVKAPESAKYKKGKWELPGTPNPNKDPLLQLDIATGSIKKFLADLELYSNIPICRLLWFTSLSRYQLDVSNPQDISFFEWELAWREDLKKPIETLEKVIDEFIQFHRNSFDRMGLAPEALDNQRVNEIEESLLTTFSVRATVQDRAEDRTKQERKLLSSQHLYLDLVEENQHVYFDGPAGTGKSILLAEAAIRSSKAGYSTLVTCWNMMMADELAKQCSPRQHVEVADLNTLMLRIAGLNDNPDGSRSEWYESELPMRAIKALEKKKSNINFDTIIIDEFQDISQHHKVLEFVLSLGHAGRVHETRLVVAGDARQQIMVDDKVRTDPYRVLKMLVPDLVKVKLKTNCRMSPTLAAELDAKFDFGLSLMAHRLPKTQGTCLEILETREGREGKDLLSAVKKLLKDYRPEDIRILSPFSAKNSFVGKLFSRESVSTAERELKALLRHQSSQGKIKWRSIAKYKGLDSDAVIITDINSKAVSFAESTNKTLNDLIYVGATRAKYRLVLLTADKVLD